MNADIFLSVGIDIGTTTTHLTASRLELANTSSYRQAPRLVIAKKEIVYSGPVHFTPLLDDGTIDANGVAEIVRQDYDAAGLAPELIRAGAVIVTGESAKRRNAQHVAEALAKFAGDFVVAGAGANLESVLAARGSGAFAASRTNASTILNADIGGGTVNVAVIANGELIDTACLGIGGRFLQLDKEGRLLQMTDSATTLLSSHGIDLKAGQRLEVELLWRLGDLVADCIFEFLTLDCAAANSLVLTAPSQIKGKIDEFWLSGGIAELFRLAAPTVDQSLETLVPYGDMGVFLATALKGKFDRAGIACVIPRSAIRATVIGAGMHALQLSGSTIEICHDALPIRNLPLVRLRIDAEEHALAELVAALGAQVAHTDLDWTRRPIGIYIQTVHGLGYRRLKQLSMDLAQLFNHFRACQPYIVVVQHDVAAALGLLLRQQLSGCQLIVIDGIEPEDGDYIDIGNPLVHSQLGSSLTALPVVIKSLVFNQ